MSHPFKIVAIWCSYDGTGFHGYQQQGLLRTVQREILLAFNQAGLERKPVVAGRTDKGVSARMQVLSGRIAREIEPQQIVARVNSHLPSDIRLHFAREVPAKFHAAFSSVSKEYRYQLAETEVGSVTKLLEAATSVPGTRDYRVFHFKSSQMKDRTVRSVELLEGNVLRFRGEGFARHMVRMLVGGLTAVSRGDVSIDAFRAGLEQQTKFDCPTAAAEPLTLWEVGYPAEVDPFTAEERSRFVWPLAATTHAPPKEDRPLP